jgi:hypothetical protein
VSCLPFGHFSANTVLPLQQQILFLLQQLHFGMIRLVLVGPLSAEITSPCYFSLPVHCPVPWCTKHSCVMHCAHAVIWTSCWVSCLYRQHGCSSRRCHHSQVLVVLCVSGNSQGRPISGLIMPSSAVCATDPNRIDGFVFSCTLVSIDNELP